MKQMMSKVGDEGNMKFMPCTFIDGKADMWNVKEAIFSAAHDLAYYIETIETVSRFNTDSWVPVPVPVTRNSKLKTERPSKVAAGIVKL
ncbi:hypothetical protein C5G87_11300 [Paenibacillus peoriae]|nr:hypothetical protein C5G87_11300 [Paenibacillus peoriae]